MDTHIYDNLPPEDNAMLQALYSRSPKGVLEQLERLKSVDAGKFMEQYYVGYGHESIADCGSTTIFIEGVSMYAAKMIQQNPLYRGQEASTRYQDFLKLHKQPFHSFMHTELSTGQDRVEYEKICECLLDLYEQVFPLLQKGIEAAYEIDAQNKTHTRAVFAYACDIAGALLPIATKTNLSWHTDLRQAFDHIKRLVTHPYLHVRELGNQILTQLRQRYPHTFSGEVPTEERDIEWYTGPDDLFWVQSSHPPHVWEDEGVRKILVPYLYYRKRLEMLPDWTDQFGTLTLQGMMDFRSWRDIARHRGSRISFPDIAENRGVFAADYVDRLNRYLPTEVFDKLCNRLYPLIRRAQSLGDPELYVMALPMGVNVPLSYSATLRQALYVAELRSARNVHFTVRTFAQSIGRYLDRLNIPNYTCHDPSEFSVSRGNQTITEKKE